MAKRELVFQTCIKLILEKDYYVEARKWLSRTLTSDPKVFYEVVDLDLSPYELRDYVVQNEHFQSRLKEIFPSNVTCTWIKEDYIEAKTKIFRLIKSIKAEGTDDNLYEAFRKWRTQPVQ